MGLGRFGGGVGAVRFLVGRGARVTVTDSADEAALAESLSQIADRKIERLRLGGHDEADFRDADLVVASPAVPPEHPLLRSAEGRGVPVTTEIGLFWAHCRGQVVGVTGSVGKSTTSAMIHAVLAGSGRTAWLGGNIGVSLLPDVDRITAEDWVVLELSSFQLERIAPLRPRPAVAVVTNFRPNHLDRHGTLDAYRAAKQNLLQFQTAEDVAVLNADDSDVAGWSTEARGFRFGHESGPSGAPGVFIKDGAFAFYDGTAGDRPEGVPGTSISGVARPEARRAWPSVPRCSPRPFWACHPVTPRLRIPGEHHLLNAAAAAAAAFAIGVEPAEIVRSLEAFRGLPHRLEILGETAGRLWVNDSKATTPESAVAALRSFERPVRLIAGGADKGVDLSPLADEVVRRGAAVYLSGRTGPAIAESLAERKHAAVMVCETFDDSVAAAWADSRPGDVILLSPACASWWQFRDYRERGERFAELAGQLAGLVPQEHPV
jgi:UDP-N-acetylmuramoylalanine--D-glutamate ligase